MQQFSKRSRRIAGLFLSIIVAACGGGGGGGDSPDPQSSNDAASADSNISSTSDRVPAGDAIFLKSPAVIRDVTYEGLPAHVTHLEIGYTGDVSSFGSRTLYAKLVQDKEVFFPDSRVWPGAGQSVTLGLRGSDSFPLPAGRTTGMFQLFACWDPACTSQLPGSPLSVGYDIEALPGPTLSPDRLQQSTRYGEAAPPRTVTVTPPPGGTSWDLSPDGMVPGADPASLFLVPSWLHRSGDTTFSFEPPADLLPGTYAREFTLRAAVADPKFPSVSYVLKKTLLISHTVVPTGAYALTPTSETVTASLSGPPPSRIAPTLVGQTPGYFSRRGIRTDAYPAAAAGHPLLANWLAFSFGPDVSTAEYDINYCSGLYLDKICLPPGTYRGAILMRRNGADGVNTDFELPVTLVLTP